MISNILSNPTTLDQPYSDDTRSLRGPHNDFYWNDTASGQGDYDASDTWTIAAVFFTQFVVVFGVIVYAMCKLTAPTSSDGLTIASSEGAMSDHLSEADATANHSARSALRRSQSICASFAGDE